MNPLGTDTRVSSCLGLTQWMNKSWTVPFNLVDCPNLPPQNVIVWNTHLRLLYFLPELSFFPYCQVLETEGLCPTQILMLKPSVQCAGIRRWGFWEVIRIRGHEGEALMHRIRALKRDQRSASFFVLSALWGHNKTLEVWNLEGSPHRNSATPAPWSSHSSPQK